MYADMQCNVTPMQIYLLTHQLSQLIKTEVRAVAKWPNERSVYDLRKSFGVISPPVWGKNGQQLFVVILLCYMCIGSNSRNYTATSK